MKKVEKVLNDDEEILWEGTPKFWPFCFSSLGFSLIGIPFLLMFGLYLISTLADIKWLIYYYGILPVFIILLTTTFFILLGFAIAFGIPIYRGLAYKHVYYVITDKRVVLQSGLVGRDFQIVDFDKITHAEIKVRVIDKLLGKGSGNIKIFTLGMVKHKPYTLSHIPNPHEISKFLKVSFTTMKKAKIDMFPIYLFIAFAGLLIGTLLILLIL